MDITEYLRKTLSDRKWIPEELCARAMSLAKSGRITMAEIDSHISGLEKEFFKPYDRMGNKIEYYKVERKLFPCRKDDFIVISRRYAFQEISGDYEIKIIPYLDYAYCVGEEYLDSSVIVNAENNRLKIPCCFASEQMYIVKCWRLDANKDRHLFVEFQVYALEEDLFSVQYLKGDFHSHTTRSDGFEPPELVIAAARSKGLDFLAVTDHNTFSGSVEAAKKAAEIGCGLTVIKGEEYSSFYTPLHIISLGAETALDYYNYSYECIMGKDKNGTLDSRIKKIYDEAPDMPCDKLSYAATQFLFDRIHENGGVSVLCHPMWKPIGGDTPRFDGPISLINELVKNPRFDAFEVVSGSPLGKSSVSNTQHAVSLQNPHLAESCALVGVTDSHYYSGDPITGKHYTIVFSEDNSEHSILDAVRKRRTIAVEIDESGKAYCYGASRYVMLAHFLIANYFPQRDMQAYSDGRKMFERICADE